MNLDSCTSGQRQIVTTLNKPLMVSAGAGSGKTFTLTQRIAYALEGEEDGTPFLDSISQVMAITFTKKAAAELKSRIKAKLMGMGLVEEALKVDDAWISTIHGACSRILREHALELGIDPAFSVVSQTEEDDFRELAFDNVMKSLEESEDEDLKAFVGQVGVAKIRDMVALLTDRALSLPDGFDAVVMPRVEGNPSQLMRQQIERGETLIACIDALPKIKKNDTKARDAAQDALIKAQDYMDGFGGASAFDAPGFDAASFADAFYAFPKTVKGSHTKESDPTFFAEYRIEYAQASAQVEAALSAIELGYVMQLARAIDEEYQQAKGASALDNTDLLRFAYQALCQNPEIAAAYRNQFKLVMIDEFQDTDELQVALIGALAEKGYSNVCTVGDAQQSIYRFRGADVNVFFGYREMLQRECPEANFVNLPDNFRSHADVLSFVDKVFSQPQVFGEHFLSLAPKGAVNNEPDPLFNTNPRVSMAVYDCQKGGPGTNGARALYAERIAQHFERLREGGASAGEMVILLGGMSNVDLYAQALRNHGFECLVAGGSTFGKAYEVGLVVAMVRYFANRADDSVLFELLESPLFAIGGTGMLHLVTGHDRRGNAHRRTLSAGLHAWPDEKGLTGLSSEQEDQIDFAHLCLTKALAHAKAYGLASGVRALLRASGWLLRLEGMGAEGQAVVGNLGKALRMLDENHKQGLGLVRSANQFCADVEASKLTPGTLSANDSNFVRIMTIHSSKGLEFPHVAIADLRLTTQAVSLVAENIQGNTYLSMSPVCLHAYSNTVDGLREFLDGEAGAADSVPEADYTARMRLLKKHYSLQELSEQRRLLYVALTRASKSLFVAMAEPSNRNLYTSNGVFKDMYDALQWESSETALQQKLNYGGSALMDFELHVLAEPTEELDAEVPQEQPFLIPGAPLGKQPFSEPYRVQHPEVFSYSSIAPHSPVVPVSAESFELDASAGLEDQDATALGTAFHRLAQLAIVQGEGKLACPSAEAVAAQVRAQGLSAQQALRLDAALQLWFNSGVAQQLAAHGKPQAEVPFMLCIPSAVGRLYLEGEIDAVSFNEAGEAFLVDYKTGGTDAETPDCLQQKHLLQAQCYALALLRQGVPSVSANFVRVERESAEEPGQPQVVRYSFDASQAEELQRLVLLAYAQYLE